MWFKACKMIPRAIFIDIYIYFLHDAWIFSVFFIPFQFSCISLFVTIFNFLLHCIQFSWLCRWCDVACEYTYSVLLCETSKGLKLFRDQSIKWHVHIYSWWTFFDYCVLTRILFNNFEKNWIKNDALSNNTAEQVIS